MKLKAQVTQIHYCVALNSRQWNRLNKVNRQGDDRWDEVSQALVAAGVEIRSLEYNGHFGRNIFFAIEPQISLDGVLSEIERFVGK